MRCALKFYVFYTTLLAKLAFCIRTTFGIYHKHIGLNNVECRNEVKHTAALIDIGILYSLDILHHKQAFLLREHRFAMLVLLVGCV